jgi:hypothetical protein
MKNSLLSFLLIATALLLTSDSYSQADNPCGTDYLRALTDSDSTSKADFDSVRMTLWNQINSHSVVFSSDYVIPVVVHIVGNTATAAVTDAG